MKTKVTKICTIALAVTMAVFLVLHFVPWFGSVSLASYLAFPMDHAETTNALAAQIEGYHINQIVGGCILLQVGALALLILLARFWDNIVVAACGGILGLSGVLYYSLNSAMRLGGSARTLMILTGVLMLAAGAVSVYVSLRSAARREEEPELLDSGEETIAHQH